MSCYRYNTRTHTQMLKRPGSRMLTGLMSYLQAVLVGGPQQPPPPPPPLPPLPRAFREVEATPDLSELRKLLGQIGPTCAIERDFLLTKAGGCTVISVPDDADAINQLVLLTIAVELFAGTQQHDMCCWVLQEVPPDRLMGFLKAAEGQEWLSVKTCSFLSCDSTKLYLEDWVCVNRLVRMMLEHKFRAAEERIKALNAAEREESKASRDLTNARFRTIVNPGDKEVQARYVKALYHYEYAEAQVTWAERKLEEVAPEEAAKRRETKERLLLRKQRELQKWSF